MSVTDNYESWRNWTLDEVVEETRKILEVAEYPPNASFSPMALHYYREGMLLELRHRNEVFAATWLSEHASKEALCQWCMAEATRFVNERKKYKQKLLRRRSQS